MDVTFETFRFSNSGSPTVCRLFPAEAFPPRAGTDPSVAWRLNMPAIPGDEEEGNPYGPAPGRIASPPFVLEPTQFELGTG